MKIQLASDLHLEFLAEKRPDEHIVQPAPHAEVLVLAGDIGKGINMVRRFRDWPVPVLYVAENHEGYGGAMHNVIAQLRLAAEGTAVRFLERERVDLSGARVLGTTLWTDYALRVSEGLTVLAAIEVARRTMTDHTSIWWNGISFGPEQALELHQQSRAWLVEQLAQPFDGPTVVVTDHGVHPMSIHPRFAGDIVNASFVSDLEPLLGQTNP